jgi:hypothetical protein
VQNYVSRLRRQLRQVDPAGSAWIATRPPGYEMVVDEDVIDVSQARTLLARSRHEHPVRRAEMLRGALDLWRGPALADVSHRIAASELEDLRLAVLEARIEADRPRPPLRVPTRGDRGTTATGSSRGLPGNGAQNGPLPSGPDPVGRGHTLPAPVATSAGPTPSGRPADP